MRLRIVACAAVAMATLVLHGLSAQEKAATGEAGKAQNQGPRIVPSAKAFLETLSDDLRSKAVLEFGTEKRLQWHFIPMETRKGLPLMEMKENQKEAAMQLLRSVVSETGYSKATQIMQLETLLLQLEGPKSEGRRNPEKYYFTIFGTPKQNERWGLSVEGHHISLNFVFQGSKFLDSTPQFFAANPAQLKDDYGDRFPKGLRVLQAEEQQAFNLVKSLTADQMAKAELPGETPGEIRGAGEPQPPNEAARGIAAADLNEEQRAILKKIMQAYTSKMKPLVAKARWEMIDNAGFEKIHFAWSGAKRPGVGHYYAIQGPTFVIEFINVQPDAAGNPANHIHCVWRDMQGDFDLPIAAN